MKIPSSPLAFFIFVTRPYLRFAIPATLVVILGAIIGQSLPLFYKWIIEAIEAGQVENALKLGLLYPAVVFLESNIWRMSGFLGRNWIVNAKQYANDVLVVHTLQQSHDYFSNRFAGAL